MPSVRADIITRGRYCRPKQDGSFETWDEVVNRVTLHQRWLWSRVGTPDDEELNKLRGILQTRRALLAGRTLWLGGTDTARAREASQFNCSFLRVETVHDVVDSAWLLLQGCGVGFKAVPGQLNGFASEIPKVEILRSRRKNQDSTGSEFDSNAEHWDHATKTWRIAVGDSAEAWAKSFGKLLAGKFPACQRLIIDLSAIRAPGARLRGYGWICSGDEILADALGKIINILNERADQLLSALDIHDIVNLIGTVLSSRRSAEISLYDYGRPGWEDFATAKKDYWHPSVNKPWRSQSNNSLVFEQRPEKQELAELWGLVTDSGGSEPGFINAEAARRRAPWFSGVNPCGEILLANKGFCNLCEVDLSHPDHRDPHKLADTIYYISRANYRQTCVNLEDGILQRAWHENNQFFRLCGVGLCGIVKYPESGLVYQKMRKIAHVAANDMARELGLPLPKNITTVKPGGTLPKIMDTTEGMTKPLGRYIFNHVQFAKTDPMLEVLSNAGYYIFDHPIAKDSVLVRIPVRWDGIDFDVVDGKEVNLEPATVQLDRYKNLMDNYCDQNVSCTISYDKEEVPAIVDWQHTNWDSYVGVSFLYRTDPTKTAEDLGYPYLPQEVVTQKDYINYVKTLGPVDFNAMGTIDGLEDNECEGGMCPAR